MKITKTEIIDEIDFHTECIQYSESKGHRGDYSDFEHLARCELLLGNIKKARDYFEESDKSWEYYLKHNEKYIRERWTPRDHLSYYRRRIPVIFLAYGKDKAIEFVKQNLKDIESRWNEFYNQMEKSAKKAEEGPKVFSEEIVYHCIPMFYTYLLLNDRESLMKIVEDVNKRFEKYGKTWKRGKKEYPTFLVAKLKADIVKAIVEKDRKEFCSKVRELSNLREELLKGDYQPSDFADPELILYLEVARQTWPDVKVESSLIPEKLREKSYFELIR